MAAVSILEGRTVFERIRWSTFQSLLTDLGDHRGRLAYDRGTLEIMSPTRKHERLKRLVGRFIEAYTEELGIHLESVSSTTLIREDLERAVEPDECYYIEHASAVCGRDDLDLSRDPPPDLAVEVDITRSSVDRRSIHAAIGVAELWRHDGTSLRVFRLGDDRRFEPVSESVALPGFPLAELERLLAGGSKASETELVRAFRRFVREHFETR